jgi:hypothetical protein
MDLNHGPPLRKTDAYQRLPNDLNLFMVEYTYRCFME